MKRQIIYISGIARSGSTFFAYSLYNMFRSFLAGEVMTNREIFQSESKLKRYHKEGRRCTCGEKPEKCQYWGPILQDNNLINEVDYYNCCLRYTEKFMDEGNTVFIDSSKSIKRLNKVFKYVRIRCHLSNSYNKTLQGTNLSVKKYSGGKAFVQEIYDFTGHVHWIYQTQLLSYISCIVKGINRGF